MGKSRRRSEGESFWRSMTDQQRASGLSVRQFCRGQRLSESSFHYWTRKLGSAQSKVQTAERDSTIVPVQIVDSDNIDDQSMIEILIPSGITLRCSAALDRQAIASLISAIQSVSMRVGEQRSC